MCDCEFCFAKRAKWSAAAYHEVVELKTARRAADSVAEGVVPGVPSLPRGDRHHEPSCSSFAGAGGNTGECLGFAEVFGGRDRTRLPREAGDVLTDRWLFVQRTKGTDVANKALFEGRLSGRRKALTARMRAS